MTNTRQVEFTFEIDEHGQLAENKRYCQRVNRRCHYVFFRQFSLWHTVLIFTSPNYLPFRKTNLYDPEFVWPIAEWVVISLLPCLRKVPSLLELSSYVLCFHNVMIGPTMFYKDYDDFIHGRNVGIGTAAYLVSHQILQSVSYNFFWNAFWAEMTLSYII